MKIIAATIVALGLSLGLAVPAYAAPTPQQCAAAQTGIDNLRKLASQYPQYASIYNAMADREAAAARASGCPAVR